MAGKEEVVGYDETENWKTILQFPAWQEGLFAVLYVMNSGAHGGQNGRKDRLSSAFEMCFEILKTLLEALQNIPFVLQGLAILTCSDLKLNLACFVSLSDSPWFPSSATELQYYIVVGLQCLLVYVMAVVSMIVASTFQKRDIQFVWPIIFLRTSVRIFVTVFFTSVAQNQLAVFSCPVLQKVTQGNGFECYTAQHYALMAACAISLVMFVPFAFYTGLLYGTFELQEDDPGATVHGRVEVSTVVGKMCIILAYTINQSADNASVSVLCKLVTLLSCLVPALMQAVQTPGGLDACVRE